MKKQRDARQLIEETERQINSEIEKGEKILSPRLLMQERESIGKIEKEAANIIDEAVAAALDINESSKGKMKDAVDRLLSYILPGTKP